MQTTHKIPGSSATRWARYMLSRRSRADYQLRDGDQDVPTSWHGSKTTLAKFGLQPAQEVELKHLRPLMHGFNPITKQEIRPVGANGTRTAGVDLTYSPPKDVSALWAMSDHYHRAQIEAAHRAAVASTLEHIQQTVPVIRRKTNGVVRFEKAKSLLAAEAVHTTSRLSREQPQDGIPDPQLHSHVTIIAAERMDGKMAAVESRQVMLAAREGGSWYRAELARNLQQLGLTIERRQGKDQRYFGIAGVPKELSEHWSTREGDVDRAANTFRRRYGREPGPGELDQITLTTRGPKSTATDTDIEQAYTAIGSELGLTRQQATNLPADQPTIPDPNIDLRNDLLTEVTRERSMITKRELHAKAYELSAGVCRPGQADQLIHDLEHTGEVIRLEDGLYTTRQLRQLEQTTINRAQSRANDRPAPVNDETLRQAVREKSRELRGSLSEEQKRALETITGQGGVSVLVGHAGTGKGVVLSAATRAWQLEGNKVIGTAIAGATAKRLQADTRSDQALTTDALVSRVEKDQIRLDSKTVVVMDEAGMADTHRLGKLVKLTTNHQTKLVLAGDSAQLSPIGPGGLFKTIENSVPTAELTDVHRARHAWERDAWQDIRNGEPGTALARYQANDRLHLHDTRQDAMQAMVNRWDQSRKTVPNGQAVMITDSSNAERDQLNAMAQERRTHAGELGSNRVQLADKPYGLAAGDEIIFTGQHRIPREARVENGVLGTITHTDPHESRVTIRTREPNPREIEVDTTKFSDLSLGYALHLYKAQGITAETAQILTGGWQTDRETVYVAVTRARDCTDIHVTRDDLGDMDPQAIQRLADLMARSRAEQASITQDTTHPTPDRSAEAPAPPRSAATQRPHHEIADVVHARQQRRLDWQDANDLDNTGTLDEKTRELQAIENLAEQLRHDGATEPAITQEIAKLTEGPDAHLQRGTQAQREHEQYIDQVLQQQRQRLLDSDERSHLDHDPTIDSSLRQQDTIDARSERDRAIQEAIEANEQRQLDWQQGIEPDSDIDNGYGIE